MTTLINRTAATARQLVDQILAAAEATAATWTARIVDGQHFDMENDPYDVPGGAGVLFTTTTSNGMTATVSLNVSEPYEYDRADAFEGWTVEGHTGFNGRTFTRRGIDVASVRLTSNIDLRSHQYAGIVALLANELNRCAAAFARAQSAVPVPGLPFSVQPDWFGKSAATLRAGKPVTLYPHGMGTGYTLTNKPARGRGRYRANPGLENALGVSPVYVEPLDCD